MKKIETISKLEEKTNTEIILQAIEDFVPAEIEEKELDKKALYKFLDSKLSFEELVLMIGREKAEAAKYTHDLRKKGKEFLGSLEE